jgi:nitrogen-specific signal transduction histidine kinase/ABC-type branched-subunit amino acid transport system ATPase component
MNEDVIISATKLSVFKKEGETLRQIDIDIMRGEIHAIVGDNNSGKTLLAETVGGFEKRYNGQICYNGKLLINHSLAKAIKLGIETIHHTPQIVSTFSVFDNIFLPKILKNFFRNYDENALSTLATNKLRAFSVDIDLQKPIGQCKKCDIPIIYIVRGICTPCKILIVDEISSWLSAAQIETFQNELSLLREKGLTIIYITSNVEEVYHFANRVSFLQDGKMLSTEIATNLGKLELVQLSYSHLYSRKELERNNFELFYLKNYYENIIKNIPIPLLMINSEKKILYINDILANNFAVYKDRYIGKSVFEIFPEKSQEYEYFMSDVFKSDTRLLHFSQTKLVTKDNIGLFNMYKIPIYDEENSFLGCILYFDMLGHLKVDIEMYKERFMAIRRMPFFAHEMRNPLAILNNFLELIKEKSTSDDIKEYLGRSVREIKRINNIINNLMKEQSVVGESMKAEGVKLWLLAEEIKNLFMPTIKDKRITLRNNMPKDLKLNYNEDELKEVLINLILNAIEAITKDGKIDLSSGFETLDGKSYIVIRVTDDGKGIDGKDKKMIFDPFFSTKIGKERRGLGLSICRDIVRSWGGMITVESELNIGSTFSIYLQS